MTSLCIVIKVKKVFLHGDFQAQRYKKWSSLFESDTNFLATVIEICVARFHVPTSYLGWKDLLDVGFSAAIIERKRLGAKNRLDYFEIIDEKEEEYESIVTGNVNKTLFEFREQNEDWGK